MSQFEHPYVEHSEHLEFIVPGSAIDEAFFNDLLQAMVEATEKTGKRRVFVDRSQSDQSIPTDAMVVYRLAIRVGEAFGASVRIAAFSPWAENDSFWENVATNRGAIVKASNDRESLLSWLLSDD
ncbi:hypothetical protein [Bremerella alba]|uniref:STAS/SEC14 domain-containing protein n=1 Tax=Bremerella alba TaxID=980252 RepID=A0A7V8VAI0_9BACT|nr:hypothetical protein [Bremerella alba]MBA2117963.1 hypothetical protein [Bremerella alba]